MEEHRKQQITWSNEPNSLGSDEQGMKEGNVLRLSCEVKDMSYYTPRQRWV